MDVVIEASGAPPAVVSCLKALRKGGVMVQLGNTPAAEFPVPWIRFLSMEIAVHGTNQFNTEFDTAVALIASGRVDPLPMLTHQFKFEQAAEAFQIARDRNVCMKAQFLP